MSIFSRWVIPVAGILVLFLVSCSGGGSSGDGSASGESIYDAGVSVGALPFAQSSKVKLFLADAGGNSVQLHDGDFVQAGTYSFAVQVSGGSSAVERVFVSDGGTFQVEAFFRDGSYVCEFPVRDDNLYQTVLVQAFHPGGKASKEKIVLRVSRSYGGAAYIKNGIGVLLSQDILDDQRDGLGRELAEKMGALFTSLVSANPGVFSSLSFGDADPATADVVVNSLEAGGSAACPDGDLHLNFTLKNVTFSGLPLFGQDFVSTSHNDLAIDVFLAIRDADGQGRVRLVLDPMGSARAAFAGPFFFQGVIEEEIASGIGSIDLPPIALDIDALFGEWKDSLPASVVVNEQDVDVRTLLDRLGGDLEKYLFVDAYDWSGGSLPGALALGLGLCVQDSDEITWATPPVVGTPGGIDMEGVFADLLGSATDSMFRSVRQKYSGLVTTLSYGDGNPATADVAINTLVLAGTGSTNVKTAQIDFTVRMVDLQAVSLFGLSAISTSNNDLDVRATFTLEYRETAGGKQIVVTPSSVTSTVFRQWFLGKSSVESMIRQELQDMGATSFDLESILSRFDLGMDISGAFLTRGSYAVFPDLDPFNQVPGWGLELSSTWNLRLALSQNCLNWVLEDLVGSLSEWDVKEILIPVLGGSFSGLGTDRPQGEETVLTFSVPPAVDLRDAKIRLLIPGAVVQYRLSGVPQWEASLDLDLVVTPVVEGGMLNFYATPSASGNHFHIMKDDRGNLGVFDHSALVESTVRRLPEMLGKPAGGPVLSVDLGSLGSDIVLKSVPDPVKVTVGTGYLYVDIAALTVDLVKYIDRLGW